MSAPDFDLLWYKRSLIEHLKDIGRLAKQAEQGNQTSYDALVWIVCHHKDWIDWHYKDEKSRTVQKQALKDLASLGPKSIDGLIDIATSHCSLQLRTSAMSRIAEFDNEAAIEFLIETVKNDGGAIAESAVKKLAGFKDNERVIDTLIYSATKHGSYKRVRPLAVTELGKFEGERTINCLKHIIDTPNYGRRLRAHAGGTLLQFEDEEVCESARKQMRKNGIKPEIAFVPPRQRC